VKRMNLQHACLSRPGLSAIVLGGIFIAGCLLEPVGVNKAVGAIPRVAPGGTLELSFVVPAAAKKASFELVIPEGVEASPPTIPPDEDPEDGFVAKIPTSGLPKNFYEVQMFIEAAEAEAAVFAAARSFVIADPSATGSAEPAPDASATPTATPTSSASTTPAPSPSVRASTTPAPSPVASASTIPASSPSASATTTPASSPSATTTPGPSPLSSPAAWRVSGRLR